VAKALEVSKQVASEASSILEDDTQELPSLNQEVDVYDAETTETLIFVDGIGVKKQSETRESKTSSGSSEKETENNESRVNTNIVLLEKKTGDFEHITSAIDKKGEELLPQSDIVKSIVIQEYGNESEPLNIVAITDGAKNIRTMLMATFGFLVVIILDWYHLRKKVRELMSMIARNKSEKIEHLEFLLHHLWHGQTDEVLQYLRTKIKAKNQEKLQELMTYIEKPQEEIIDYDQRKKAGKEVGIEPEEVDSVDLKSFSNDEAVKKAGSERVEKAYEDALKRYQVPKEDSEIQNQSSSVKKVVGSGRVEKACDSIIGKRQKRKAFVGGKVGSRSLAMKESS
jgi:hypothetical protein